MHGIKHVESANPDPAVDRVAYAADHEDDPPDFIVVASSVGGSAAYGGYAINTPPLEGFCNDFSSPRGNKIIYGAVVARTHRFAACGYDLDHYQQTLEWTQVSDVSLADGSCINTPGVECVPNEAVGYNVCSNVDPDHLYLSTADTFTSTLFLHEIMHRSGVAGIDDHFGTPACNAKMGGTTSQEPPGASEQHFAMCPYVYDNFVDGCFSPCEDISEDCSPVLPFASTLPAPELNAAEVKLGGGDSTDWQLVGAALGGASDPLGAAVALPRSVQPRPRRRSRPA